MKVYTAPEALHNITKYENRIFLGGSIENGNAELWQEYVIARLGSSGLLNTCVFNPRRREWLDNVEQSYYDTILNQQVNWELNALERSTKILMYFQQDTISPISLLELGLFHSDAIVVCPNGYFRKGNIDIVCERYRTPIYTNLDEAISELI